ncbi:hypothetical protein [Paenisporosarcina sp. TG20]|uniref:hypothetical protein n=1 Tax=Paenisporosarcina sp. TG20 TaxID=1211706 RepID=UPI0003061C69|nr:hypothetical protein [Paenisporosarcina sp. TG20]
MFNNHLHLTPFIHIDDFQQIRINGPFELTVLSPHSCQLSGNGYILIIESENTLISSMNVEEVIINVQELKRLELRKMEIV